MTDNITEADERIIQLLAALNSTLGSYTASQESDTSDNLANQLSSTALVVSLIALIVALLQAVLEYVSSNSAQGDKCDTGAIGEWARVSRRRRWSWRRWRWKYFYPELNLNLLDVSLLGHDPESSEVGQVFKGLANLTTARLEDYEERGPQDHERKEYYSWRYYPVLDSIQPRHFIRNGRHYLCRRTCTGEASRACVLVTPRNLPMKYRLKWFFHCISCGRANDNTPRATWAQLLTLLNVDPMRMKWNNPRAVDANSIPSCLDVPAQKVELVDLGCFAFSLGFRHIDINTQARRILATGETGTITTESMPGFGAVVILQVSSPWPRYFVVEGSRDLVFHRRQLLGSFIFDDTHKAPTNRYSSLLQKFVKARPSLDIDARCPTISDEAKWWLETTKSCQHERSEASETDLCLECLEKWQRLVGGRSWPTILLAASAASIPRITTGYPSPVFLDPFLRVFQHLAYSLSAQSGAIWSQYNLGNSWERSTLLILLKNDLCRVADPEHLTWGKGGHLSWMQNPCGLDNIKVIEKVLLARNPPIPIISSSRGVQRRSSRFYQGRQPSDTEAPATSDSVNAESLTEGCLMPYIRELLDTFNPVSWAADMRGQSSPKYDQRQTDCTVGDKGRWAYGMQPHNVLWAQAFLLDLAITKARYKHDISIEDVSAALVESWEEPISKASAPLQNLYQFLHQKASTNQTSEESPKKAEEFRGLADMIKTRMLCYIAYMMVFPDSTSLYKASLEDPVVLPMI